MGLGGTGCGGEAPIPPADFVDALPEFEGDPGALAFAHSHNDYEQERPLLDALEHRFASVEVDVFLRGDTLAVAHYPWQTRGELSALYLDPLVALVQERGSAYGDGRPFTLWIDLKDDVDPLLDILHERLAAHPTVFTRYEGDDVIEQRPIEVVLTGAAAKVRYVERETRFAIRDSNGFATSDPRSNARWGLYARPDAEVREADADLDSAYQSAADSAHALGRRLRVYASPDDEQTWCAQLRAGFDFIGTDRIGDLAAVLSDDGACGTR